MHAKLKVLTTAMVLLALQGCGQGADSSSQSAEGWPDRPIRIVFPSSPGGGLDGNINQFLPYFGKALDARFQVDYRAGADQAVGLTLATQSAADCNTLIGLNNPTGTLFSWMSQVGVKYTNDDFRSLGSLVSDPTTWSVRSDSKWKTVGELVDYAKAHPGQVKISISHLYSNYAVSVFQVEAATGADFNLVAYSGGGPARLAVISGEVDATVDSVYAGLSSRGKTRILAVQAAKNEWADLTDNAPTLSEQLHVSLPDNSYQHTIAVPRQCAEKSPARFKKMVDAFASARSSQDYMKQLDKTHERGKVAPAQTPEQFDADVDSDKKRIESLVQKYPELSGKKK
jgi:tripartite-type tricarboxylate transporter receptor subunit TctC